MPMQNTATDRRRMAFQKPLPVLRKLTRAARRPDVPRAFPELTEAPGRTNGSLSDTIEEFKVVSRVKWVRDTLPCYM